MNTWKPNLEETKQHYRDWWNHRGIVLNMWEHFQQGVTPHADIPEPPAPRNLDQQWFDPDWRAQYLDWYVAHSSLKADILPVANTQLGPGSLAAILGARYEAGTDTIWIHPRPATVPAGSRAVPSAPTVVGDSVADTDITFDPAHPNYLLHKSLLQACKRRAQGHYYVGMPDLMEGLDVLAALFGTDRVLLDTVMNPERLERQVQQVNDIYFQVFDQLYDIIREGDEMAFCYFSAWAPGKMTKLQSDISTMISQDDYRRFVQPYIRQQCQRIPYTLYHLDGVGAIHHLPALLEIPELNAIQWTPGVGEPQGGSPKWYDLYKQILAAGKSIMACWVTIPELRPLLDAVGTEGIHIEMDFHNEQEVDQALTIVDEYRHPRTLHPAPVPAAVPAAVPAGSPAVPSPVNGGIAAVDSEVAAIIRRVESTAAVPGGSPAVPSAPIVLGGFAAEPPRLLVLDGAMGTMIQHYALDEESFRGARFATHPQDLHGCNDVLSLTAPYVIRDIHRKYLAAGADIIETNTFNAQRISLHDYGLQDHVRDINLAAAKLARQCADEFSSSVVVGGFAAAASPRPRFVAGSIGPTSRTTSVATSGEPLSKDLLRAAYAEQIQALADGGVDALLIETIFDVENARIAIDCARTVAPHLPIMLSFSVATPDGHNMLGQSILDFLHTLNKEDIYSIGLNCLSDIPAMAPLVRRLAAFGTRVSLYPNAGQPDAQGHYATTPETFVADLWPLLEGHHLNIIGGCCGTTDAHIACIARAIEPLPGLRLSPLMPGTAAPATPPSSSSVHGVTTAVPAAVPVAVPTAAVTAAAVTAGSLTDGQSVALQSPEVPSAPVVVGGFAADTPADRLFTAILNGKSDDAAAATHDAIADGAAPQDLINGQMIRAMSEVGQRFQDGKAFVPQLLMAGRAMKAALEILKPLLSGSASTSLGKVVIGTVKGDLHDIGKNLVASMLEGCGFEVVNIGIDVSADAFIDAVKENQPDILCMSALLTTTMGYMKDVIDALEAAGIRDQVKVMVGGAPVTQGFADEIGADGYSDNANSAVTVAKQLLGKL